MKNPRGTPFVDMSYPTLLYLLEFAPSYALGLHSIIGTPEFIVENLLVMACCLVAGVGSILIGLGRIHWFLRFIGAGCIVSLPTIVGAYELVLLLFLECLTILLVLILLRRGRVSLQLVDRAPSSRGSGPAVFRPKWSLRDQMLFVVVAAGAIALAASVPAEVWPSCVRLFLHGSFFGACALVGAWVALGTGRLRLRLILTCLLPPSAIVAIWLALLRLSGLMSKPAIQLPGTRLVVRVVALLFSVAMLTPLAVVSWWLIAPAPRVAQDVLPGPNGYDELLEAGRMFINVRVPWTDLASDEELTAFVGQYAGPLHSAHHALGNECRVSLSYTEDEILQMVDDLQATRALRRAFCAEGELAKREGRKEDAVRSYLDTILLGQKASCGGMILHAITAWEALEIGTENLRELRGFLTPEHHRDIVATLETIDRKLEPAKLFLARDRAVSVRTSPWQDRVAGLLIRLFGRFQRIHELDRTRLRLLICEFALHGYYSEEGEWPRTLEDLVPEYLATVPKDSATEAPLTYRRRSEGYLLYAANRSHAFTVNRSLDFSYPPR